MTRRAIAIVVAVSIAAGCGANSHPAGLGPVNSASSTPDRSSGQATWEDLDRGFEQGADNICTRGEVACVDAILTEMRTRFDVLVAECSHLAPWALASLRVTEAFRSTRATPDALADPVFFTHVDMWFAILYFRAFDSWYAGRKNDVPSSWQIAFEAADAKAVNGIGSLVLPINAHISRDLPVALANSGLRVDGSAELADFRKVNQIFVQVLPRIITESAARFDPTVADANVPGTAADEDALVGLIAGWREASFANGERVAGAGSARASTEAQIDAVTATQSLAIRAATSYVPFVSGPAPRDAFCRQHGKG